ncbi:MAG TPA: hypothetical protein VLA52_11905, partial [Thermohalobaculum sp.]|nr:hypothetical protein [Thermohalobaculum sp.]
MAAAILLLAPAGAPAQVFSHMDNWNPNRFEISCGKAIAPYRPASRNVGCMDSHISFSFEVLAEMALQQYRSARFPPPYRFGPVINGLESDAMSIRLFTDRDAAGSVFASVNGLSGTCSRSDDFYMDVDERSLAGKPLYFIGFVAAHELIHSIMTNAPENLKSNPNRDQGCFWPGWMEEAMADAAAIGFTRREFPNAFPIRPGTIMAENMVGLRAYNKPLYHKFGANSVDDYNTNSFWVHLADFYHSGQFKFLYDYGKVPAPTYGGNKEDWLRWLDERLTADPKVKTPLYRVYPGFLTHFAGEWARGGVGEKFGRRGPTRWLNRAFGGCATVTVTPKQNHKKIPGFKVEPMAGRCIKVRVKGVAPSDLVTVKLGVVTPDKDVADSMHLGFADTNDQTRFNCAQKAREIKPAPGLIGCLFETVTGPVGQGAVPQLWQRIWHASALEVGPGVGQQQRADTSAIENYYILSYVPPKPSLEKLESATAASLTVEVGLDWSSLSVSGESVNSGGDDGKRETVRRRSVSALAMEAMESDMMVAPSTGWVDDQGMAAMVGGGIWNVIAETRKMGSEMAAKVDPAGTLQGIMLFRLAEARIEPLGGAPSEDRIEPLRTFSVAPIEPLPKGATGSFLAMISGGDPRTRITYASPEDQPASLTVLENSESAFRATVNGVVCAMAAEEMAERIGGVVRSVLGDRPRMLTEGDLKRLEAGFEPIERDFAQICATRIRVSGSISKPFASLYQPGTELVSEETEGEK